MIKTLRITKQPDNGEFVIGAVGHTFVTKIGMIVTYALDENDDSVTFTMKNEKGGTDSTILHFGSQHYRNQTLYELKSFYAEEVADDDYNLVFPDGDKPPANNKALRYNDDKLKWSLVHFESLEPMVKVLMFGAKKYSADNWKKGLDKKEILESMMRHLAALMDGETIDAESGLPHMGHIQCNAMFFNYFENHNSNKI